MTGDFVEIRVTEYGFNGAVIHEKSFETPIENETFKATYEAPPL